MLLATALACVSLLVPTANDKGTPSAEFSSNIALSDDITFEDRWFHTASASGVHIGTTDRVERGQVFQIQVFILNPTPDASGKSNVRSDIYIKRPDGKSYHEEKDLESYRGGATRQVVLSSSLLGISFDPEDPLGKYSVRVVVRDVVAKRESIGEAQIELVERIEGKSFGTGEEAVESAGAWCFSEAAAKEPHRLIPALEIVAGADMLNDGPRGAPLRAFFREAFDAHPFLFRSLGKLAADKATKKSVRDEALLVLATCRTPAEKRLAVLPEDVRKACAALEVKSAWDPRADAIEEPGHLDQLWATFFATGSFKAVERITEVLDLEPTGKTKAAVMHKTARWSLGSIAKQNELAHAYISFMAGREETPAARKAILEEILAK